MKQHRIWTSKITVSKKKLRIRKKLNVYWSAASSVSSRSSFIQSSNIYFSRNDDALLSSDQAQWQRLDDISVACANLLHTKHHFFQVWKWSLSWRNNRTVEQKPTWNHKHSGSDGNAAWEPLPVVSNKTTLICLRIVANKTIYLNLCASNFHNCFRSAWTTDDSTFFEFFTTEDSWMQLTCIW